MVQQEALGMVPSSQLHIPQLAQPYKATLRD